MTATSRQRMSLLTPTRLLVVLAVGMLFMAGFVAIAWLSRPSIVILRVAEPIGETVLGHVVADGKAKEFQSVVPSSYRFAAKELRFAVICLDPDAVGGLSISVEGESGSSSASSESAKGIRGTWGQIPISFETMTPTHIANMRRSAGQGGSETGENTGDHL